MRRQGSRSYRQFLSLATGLCRCNPKSFVLPLGASTVILTVSYCRIEKLSRLAEYNPVGIFAHFTVPIGNVVLNPRRLYDSLEKE